MEPASILKMGLTLALLLGIPTLLLGLLRRFGLRLPGQAAEGGRLRIVARTSVDAKHVLLLVRRDAQEQLLLLGPAGPTVLESAIKLSHADRAEQRRQANEQAERQAAAEAALRHAQLRTSALLERLRRFAIGAGQRLRRSSAPAFARLVEQARRRAPAAPVRRPPARSTPKRPRRKRA